MTIAGIKGPSLDTNRPVQKQQKVQQRRLRDGEVYDLGLQKKRSFGTEDVRASATAGMATTGAPQETINLQALVKRAGSGSEAVLEASRQLGRISLEIHRSEGAALTAGQAGTAESALASAGSALRWGDQGVTYESVNNDIMTMALGGVEMNLRDFVSGVAAKQGNKSGMMEAATRLRDMAANENAEYPVDITYTYTTNEDGTYVDHEVTTTVNNADEALKLVDTIEGRMASQGDINQLQIFELQQRQQEMVQLQQTFSAIMKSFHDTGKSIVNNLRA